MVHIKRLVTFLDLTNIPRKKYMNLFNIKKTSREGLHYQHRSGRSLTYLETNTTSDSAEFAYDCSLERKYISEM